MKLSLLNIFPELILMTCIYQQLRYKIFSLSKDIGNRNLYEYLNNNPSKLFLEKNIIM